MILLAKIARLFGASMTARTTYSTSRPMTAAEMAAFDSAFAKFNEGFDELSKAFNETRP
jgi:hypothetical protein